MFGLNTAGAFFCLAWAATLLFSGNAQLSRLTSALGLNVLLWALLALSGLAVAGGIWRTVVPRSAAYAVKTFSGTLGLHVLQLSTLMSTLAWGCTAGSLLAPPQPQALVWCFALFSFLCSMVLLEVGRRTAEEVQPSRLPLLLGMPGFWFGVYLSPALLSLFALYVYSTRSAQMAMSVFSSLFTNPWILPTFVPMSALLLYGISVWTRKVRDRRPALAAVTGVVVLGLLPALLLTLLQLWSWVDPMTSLSRVSHPPGTLEQLATLMRRIDVSRGMLLFVIVAIFLGTLVTTWAMAQARHNNRRQPLSLALLCLALLLGGTVSYRNLTSEVALAQRLALATMGNAATVMATAQKADSCPRNVLSTPLTSAVAQHTVLVQGESTQDRQWADQLVQRAKQYDLPFLSAARLDSEQMSGWSVLSKVPADAWTLVLSEVKEPATSRELGYALPARDALVRAALFDDKKKEVGRWQGRMSRYALSQRTEQDCTGASKQSLWAYLGLPSEAPATSVLYGASSAFGPSADVQMVALTPSQRKSGLGAQPPAYAGASCNAAAFVRDQGGRTSNGITVQSPAGAKLNLLAPARWGNNAAASSAVLECSAQGVWLVTRNGASFMDWRGKQQRQVRYDMPGLGAKAYGVVSEAAGTYLFVPEGGEVGYRLDLSKARAAAASVAVLSPTDHGRLLPTDARTGTAPQTSQMFEAAKDASQCQATAAVEGLAKKAIRVVPAQDGRRGGFLTDAKFVSSVPLNFVSYIDGSGKPSAVLVMQMSGMSVVDLSGAPLTRYLEVLTTLDATKVVVRNAPSGLRVSVLPVLMQGRQVAGVCPSLLMGRPDSPSADTTYDGLQVVAGAPSDEELKQLGREQYFSSKSQYLAAVEKAGYFKKLDGKGVQDILEGYGKSGGGLSAIGKWLSSSPSKDVSPEVPHASESYLMKRSIALIPELQGGPGASSTVIYIDKGVKVPEQRPRELRILDINTYRCIGQEFWCPWPSDRAKPLQ